MVEVIPFSTEKVENPGPVKLTHDAQAKAFVDMQDGNLHYVAENDLWIIHNGYYWEPIPELSIIEGVRLLNRGTALMLNSRSAKLQKILSSRSFAVQTAKFAQGDERCLLPMSELDADPWLLGTPGGIIDLRTGRHIAVGLKPYVTMVTACEPADVANEDTCPLFLEFMDEFACDFDQTPDAKLKRFLQQWSGYDLTGDMREQCFLFFYGAGDNGKTVFLQLMRYLLGTYATTAAIELFVTTGIGKHLTGFAALHRKRFVLTNETQKGHTLRMDVIKNITGQDTITANFMRQDTFEFQPVCKLNMFGNHKPNLPNVGKAEKKRLRMVPCHLRLAPHEIDRDLLDKLKEEGPGILRWMIDGCLDWQANGLVEPECVKEHTSNYFYNQDQFGRWVEACCYQDVNAKSSTEALWKSWQVWSKEHGVEVGTETAFSESLGEAGFRYNKHTKMEDGSYKRGWQGLEIAQDGRG
jgi:putative DNA primase/helicase